MIIAIIIAALLVFLGVTELLYLDITGLGRKKALREFPKAAKKLGFSLKASRSRQFGVYTGIYKGYGFNIDPDSNATIYLRMPPIAGLKLSTYKDKTNFDTGDHGFDNLFIERTASPELGQKLSEATQLLTFVDQFGSRWKRKYRFIEIVEDGIYCSLKYGNGKYIPGSVLERIVPDMVNIADLLQAAVKDR